MLNAGASGTVETADGYTTFSKLTSMSYFNNNHQVLLSGHFGGFESLGNIFNILTLESNLTPLKDEVQLPSRLTGEVKKVAVPHFNGGTIEPVVRSFPTADDKVLAIGNFTQYCRNDYANSYQERIAVVYQKIGQVIRMNMAGELDENYRTGKSGLAADGTINDAIMDNDGNVIIVGKFTSFDGVPVSNLVKINTVSGEIDETFLSNLEGGVNGEIQMIRYNKKLNKMMLIGSFTEVDGKSCDGIAMLNGDGTLEESFSTRAIEGGRINFATILDSEKVVISGTFSKYDGVNRPGFLILNMDGRAIQDFNVPGELSGQIYQTVETYSTSGFKGLLLLGNIYRFNGEMAKNAVMLEIDF